MTSDEFGRAIVAYPALLRAYAGEPVTLPADDAIALLRLFDAVDELAIAEQRIIVLRESLEGGRRRRRSVAWERGLARAKGRNAP